MANSDADKDRFTLTLKPGHREFLGAVADANGASLNEVVNGFIRLARQLGDTGVKDTLTMLDPSTNEPRTILLPFDLVNPEAQRPTEEGGAHP